MLGLDGGATHTKAYNDPSESTWAYPNIHGDIIATSSGSGGLTDGSILCYDPYGTPITSAGTAEADGAPDTAPGAFDAGWLGQHQRYTEHAADLNYIQMGQRIYNPSTGRFMEVDPIEGGSANDYDYTHADPLNAFDLDGTKCKRSNVYMGGKVYKTPCQKTYKKRSFTNDVLKVTKYCQYAPIIGGPCGVANTVATCHKAGWRTKTCGKSAAATTVGFFVGKGVVKFAEKLMGRSVKSLPRIGRIATGYWADSHGNAAATGW